MEIYTLNKINNDFVCPQGKSNLEILCESRGFQIIFFPKFHCELNFIEQCWGYVKRLYRMKPESSKEAQLEINALECLDAIPIESIRRYVAEILLDWSMFLSRY